MRPSIIALAGGATAQLSLPVFVHRSVEETLLIKRDLATIQQVVTDLGTSLNNLDTAVKGFTAGDMPAQMNVISSASSLVSMIQSGTAKIAASSNITLNDAVMLQAQTSGLMTTSNTLITDLTSIKPEAEKAGACEVVQGYTQQVSDGIMGLLKVVVSKIPEAAQTLAMSATSGLTGSLAQIQGVYASGNCTDAPGVAPMTMPPASATGAPNGASSNSTAKATPTGVKPGAPSATGAASMVAAPMGALAMAMAAAVLL
ncbi:hypothetical protein P8C59_004917 [Phyllachora maydis]|uniref:Cell wall protein n=1 Tax=Phyllachora maydis TaxID=1825666 RepID=A0AAD9MBS1_9PEZI|nr:hypothetical protein P8C59_004917 [Phyllachora maydis]